MVMAATIVRTKAFLARVKRIPLTKLNMIKDIVMVIMGHWTRYLVMQGKGGLVIIMQDGKKSYMFRFTTFLFIKWVIGTIWHTIQGEGELS